jgi:hypothetical protein
VRIGRHEGALVDDPVAPGGARRRCRAPAAKQGSERQGAPVGAPPIPRTCA